MALCLKGHTATPLYAPEALAEIQQALRDGWIGPQPPREAKVWRLFVTDLDPGEAEAIALALELSADLTFWTSETGVAWPSAPPRARTAAPLPRDGVRQVRLVDAVGILGQEVAGKGVGA